MIRDNLVFEKVKFAVFIEKSIQWTWFNGVCLYDLSLHRYAGILLPHLKAKIKQ